MELRRLEGFVPGKWRQDRRQAPGEHRLARTGRADKDEVVSAGCSYLESPTRSGLTAHLAQIDLPRRSSRFAPRGHRGRFPRSAEEANHVPEVAGADDLDALDLCGFGRVP